MGSDSGGDSEKMSVESTWKLFACVTMSFLAYAVLKPIICPKKMPALPKPAEGPPIATIKVNPQRLAFKLFPPGQAHYICGPKKPPEKKKKKKTLNAKLKDAVRAIGVSNAIRDLAKSSCDVPNALVGTVNTDTSGPPPPPPPHPPPQPPNNLLKVDHHHYLQPKDPQVFSARLPAQASSTTSHLNGGASIVNTLSRRVQLRRSQRMEEDDDDEDDIDPCTSSKIRQQPLTLKPTSNTITTTTTTTVIELKNHDEDDDDHHKDEEPRRPSLRAKLKLLRSSKSIGDSSGISSGTRNHVSKKPEVTLDVRKLGNHQIIHIS